MAQIIFHQSKGQPKANILSALHLHLTQNAGRTRLQTDLPSSQRAAAKHSSQRNLPQRQSVKTSVFFVAFLRADFSRLTKIVVHIFIQFCFHISEEIPQMWKVKGMLRQQILHGIAWYCLLLHCFALFCVVLQGIAWYCMVLRGIAWYYTILHGIA